MGNFAGFGGTGGTSKKDMEALLATGQGGGSAYGGMGNKGNPFAQHMQQGERGMFGKMFGAEVFRNSPGLQEAHGAMTDFNAMTELQQRKNDKIQQLEGGLQSMITDTGIEREQRTGDIVKTADEEAAEMKAMGQENLDEFQAMQEKNRASTKKYLDEGISTAKDALEQYSTESLATVSAAAGGIQKSIDSQIEQLNQQYSNVPGGDAIVQQQTAQLRNRGMQQMQGQVSGLIDERSKIRLQAAQAVGQLQTQAGATFGAFTAKQEGTLSDRMGQTERLTQAASSMMVESRMQAAEVDLKYRQMELGGMGQLAAVMKELPMGHVSLFDTMLTVNMALSQGDVNVPFQNTTTFNGKQVTSGGGTYNPFAQGTPPPGMMGGSIGGAFDNSMASRSSIFG